MELTIIAYDESHRDWARRLLVKQWGSTTVVSRGVMYQADAGNHASRGKLIIILTTGGQGA
jgi:hypothetical protein